MTPWTNDTKGIEVWQLEVTLVDPYGLLADITLIDEFTIDFTIEVNDPPYFEEPLDDLFPVSIQRTIERKSWEIELPEIIDPEN